MQSFIISSKNLELGKNKINEIISEKHINGFDIATFEFEKTLGIEDVRNIQKDLYLSPFQGKSKAIIIILNNLATTEAQNSMLKMLEEPPKSTYILILTKNADQLIPTVLSRAKIIEIKNEILETDGSNYEKLNSEDPLLLAVSISKEKDEAIIWLEKLILELREKILTHLDREEEALKYRKMIHKIELTHYDLKTTNTNTRLALENLFLNL